MNTIKKILKTIALVLIVFALAFVLSSLAFLPYGWLILCCVVASPILAIHAWVLLAQYRLLDSIEPEFRTTSPIAVFICLIPGVGQIWNFYLAKRIGFALEDEFIVRHFDRTDEDFCRITGNRWSRNCSFTILLPGFIFFLYYALTVDLRGFLIVSLLTYIATIVSGLEYAYVLNAHREHLWGKGVAHQTEEQRDFGEE